MKILNQIEFNTESNFDVIVETKCEQTPDPIYKYYSQIIIENDIQKTILFKFWDEEEFSEYYEVIYCKESNYLFYRACYEWGIIDLNKDKVVKQELTFAGGIIERIQNSIVFDDELKVESYSLFGKLIDAAPIDPPSKREHVENELIYNSPVWGIQKLKIV